MPVAKNTKRFEITMPTAQYEALIAFSEELHMSKSKFIQIAVDHQMTAIIASVENQQKKCKKSKKGTK